MSTSRAQARGEFTEGTFAGTVGARHYKLFVPATPEPRGGRALVVMLHGCTQDASDIARGTRLNERAAALNWLVLYPEQPASANAQKCWNWYDGAHQQRDAGEPALLASLIVDVAKQQHADEKRIFVGGISAGGAMAINLVVAYPELFAAAAAHSAIPYRAATGVMAALATMKNGPQTVPELPSTTVPLLVIHGERDAVVHPRNGDQLAEQWRLAIEHGRTPAPLVRRVEESRSADGRAYRRVLYENAAGVPLVETCVISDLGHAWSGGSRDGTFTDERGPDATTLMLDFFARHAVVTTAR